MSKFFNGQSCLNKKCIEVAAINSLLKPWYLWSIPSSRKHWSVKKLSLKHWSFEHLNIEHLKHWSLNIETFCNWIKLECNWSRGNKLSIECRDIYEQCHSTSRKHLSRSYCCDLHWLFIYIGYTVFYSDSLYWLLIEYILDDD